MGDKINKFTGMIEGLIWSPRSGDGNEHDDDWAFEDVGTIITQLLYVMILIKHFLVFVCRIYNFVSAQVLSFVFH